MENNTNNAKQPYRRPQTDSIDAIKGLLGQMETQIRDARRVPVVNLSMIDGGEFMNIISELRTQISGAFAQAESIVSQESEIVSKARAQADQIADQAEMQVKKAQEEKDRILKEAENERSTILNDAQAAYDARIAQAEQDAQAMVAREEIVRRAEEAVRRAAVDRDEIILDTQKRAQQIIEEAQRSGQAIYKQATEEADKAVSGAVAAVKSYSLAFDQDADKLVEVLRGAQTLVDLLNESGERLGSFAQDMAERRDRLLHPEYFEE
ncbi:MAG: hypothetical protein IKB82_07215 [Clostridia bacterium]|nr:hypothetical protein [Clostridia bacterium]